MVHMAAAAGSAATGAPGPVSALRVAAEAAVVGRQAATTVSPEVRAFSPAAAAATAAVPVAARPVVVAAAAATAAAAADWVVVVHPVVTAAAADSVAVAVA